MAIPKNKCKLICTTLMLAVTLLSLFFWLRIRPSIGGVDFLCYLLNARDLVMGFSQNLSRYFYYPGVYEFWKVSYRLAEGDLALIQGHYVTVVILNGLLIGLILWRTCKDLLISLFGLSCYLILATRLEGTYGVTEPIGTIPVLLALLFIFPTPRLSWLQLFWLGLAFSISVFIKQQFGLIAMGVLGIFISESCGQASPLKKIKSFLLRGTFITTISTVSLIALFHLEGSGMQGILAGLSAASNYQSSGHFLLHFLWLLNASHGFFTLFLVISVTLLFTSRNFKNKQNFNLVLFCIFAALFSFVQLWKRGYLHYSLIPLPFVILAISASIHLINWVYLTDLLKMKFPALKVSATESKNFVLTGLAIYLLISANVWSGIFKPIPSHALSADAPTNTLCHYLQPGADVFVFPPQFNEVHWLCKTRLISSPLSYGWPAANEKLLKQIITSPTLTAVVLMKNEKQEFIEQSTPDGFSVQDFHAALNEKNFKVIDTPLAKIFLQKNP